MKIFVNVFNNFLIIKFYYKIFKITKNCLILANFVLFALSLKNKKDRNFEMSFNFLFNFIKYNFF